METIFNKIQKAVETNCPDVKYTRNYPKDYVKLNYTDDEILDDESIDTITPLVKAMKVIMDVIEKEGAGEDDIRVCFNHLPGEEFWGITIGDGR